MTIDKMIDEFKEATEIAENCTHTQKTKYTKLCREVTDFLLWFRNQDFIDRNDAIKGIQKDVFEDVCDAETCYAINGTSCPCGSGCNNPCGICFIKNMDKAQYKGE